MTFAVSILLAIFLVICFVVWKKIRPQENRFRTANAPRDTVLLHQYGPSPYAPSISPFVMKLETFLRASDIPYQNIYDRKPGPKGKLPWIEYNGVVVPDSQHCIEFLRAEKGVELNKRLTEKQWAVGHLMRRTAEESLYWALLMWRLSFEKHGTIYRQLGLPSFIIWYMRRAASGRLWSQGIGRHSEKEVTHIMQEDLASISCFIGKKSFLFGNTPDDVTEFDCALFGQLCQLMWQMPGCPVETTIKENYPNIARFCESMKAAFWPDWEKRLKSQQKTEAKDKTGNSQTVNSLSGTNSSNQDGMLGTKIEAPVAVM